MIKIYIVGHGVMVEDGHAFTTVLKHDFNTYVKAGKMFDSNGSSGVIDGGAYAPPHQSSKTDAEGKSFKRGATIPTHWIYSTRMGMFMDLKGSAKMQAAKATINAKMVQLLDSGGKLYPLGDDIYVYITEDNVLTSLGTLQDGIDAKLAGKEYEFHWTACRSHVQGDTNAEILAYMKENGADAEDLSKII